MMYNICYYYNLVIKYMGYVLNTRIVIPINMSKYINTNEY